MYFCIPLARTRSIVFILINKDTEVLRVRFKGKVSLHCKM